MSNFFLFGENDTPEDVYKLYKKVVNNNFDISYIIEIEKAKKSYSDRAELYAIASNIYKLSNSYEEAIWNISKSIEINNNNATYYSSRGVVLFSVGLFYEALDDFDEIIDNSTLSNREYFLNDAYQNRLLIYCCIGYWDKAKENIKYLDESYVYYIKSISGKIDKQRVEEAINEKSYLCQQE